MCVSAFSREGSTRSKGKGSPGEGETDSIDAAINRYIKTSHTADEEHVSSPESEGGMCF